MLGIPNYGDISYVPGYDSFFSWDVELHIFIYRIYRPNWYPDLLDYETTSNDTPGEWLNHEAQMFAPEICWVDLDGAEMQTVGCALQSFLLGAAWMAWQKPGRFNMLKKKT